MTCWVCGRAIDEGEASIVPAKLPRAHRAREGARVHLRCHGEWGEERRAPKPARSERHRLSLPDAGGYLYAADLARLRGISARQARRWLVRLEEQYGEQVVGRVDARRGVRRYTSAAALAAIGPGY